MAAADVRDARARLELVLDPVERGDPLARQMGAIAGAEEPLGALEQARVMIAPGERAVAGERGLDLLHVHEHRPERIHRPRHEHRRCVVRQRHRRLRAQRIPIRLGVVLDEPGRSLTVEPLAHQPRVTAGLPGQLVRAPRGLPRERPV